MLLLKGGYVIDPKSKTEDYLDVLCKEDKIIKIGKNLNEDCETLDVTGCIIGPGLVDVHVHFRDPGFTYKEDIVTGAKAAAKGGFTTVVLMANTKPVVDNVETLQYIIQKGNTTDIHIKTCATITKGMKGKELVPMESLLQAGAVGFTDDGIPIMDEEILKQAMVKASELKIPISLHEENPKLITNNGINSNIAKRHFDMIGSPREAEIEMVQRDLEMAIKTNCICNIQHISTKEAVELVRVAKTKGGNIYAEATPHHFTLTEEAIVKYGTLAKMNPPLREEADRIAIIEGLKDGTIDIIATDHAPHSIEEKEKPLQEAPSGIIGLETALSLGVTHLVNKGHISHMELLGKMSYAPANMYQLKAGYIQEDGPSDLVIYHPKSTWKIGDYLSKSENTPFTGETLEGVVVATICNGKIVYQNK